MTTPQIPSNQLAVSDISDEINPAGYTQGQQAVSNNTIRQLTGQQAKTVNGAELLLSDLSNKVAFSEIISQSSNVQSGVIVVSESLYSELTLQANSDMYDPYINWTYAIENDSVNVTTNDITISKPTSKTAIVKLQTSTGTKVANLTITGVMSVDGHTVNTCTKNINLTINSVNTAFDVTATPSFTVNAFGVVAQTATIILNASVNTQLAGTSFVFTPTFVSGTGTLSPIVNSNNISFTATAASPTTNAAVYSVRTDLYYQNKYVGTKTSTVDITAQYIARNITSLTSAGTSNNQFANAQNQYSTIDITAVHNSLAPYPQGTITFTVQSTGDTVTQQTISSNTSSKTERISLLHSYDQDGYGFKKATVDVIATLTTAYGTHDQQKLNGIVLRAGAYGLTFQSPQSNTQQGYGAQTATTTATATWRAGNFTWTPRQFNGQGPQLTISNNGNSSTIDIIATTPSGKNKGQTITNTCNYDLTGTLVYDGVEVSSKTLSDILIKAESLPYTYSIQAASQSNVQVEVDSGTTASIVVTGTTTAGTITWTRDNGSVGITTNSTQANVFVTSSQSGSSNNQNVAVTGTLVDGSSRLIESITTQPINIDATTTKLQIFGSNTSIVSDQRVASAVGAYESTSVFGSNLIVFPPVKLSGNTLDLYQDAANRIRIVASANQTTKSGVYRLTGNVTYRGITRSITKDVSVSVSAIAPSLTITPSRYSYSEYGYSGIDFFDFFGTQFIGGIIGAQAYISYQGVDLVAETDYPGTINTDYTITRVVSSPRSDQATITGPFYNQSANGSEAPAGYPGSINKRRDRFESIAGGESLHYDVTYELRDPNNNLLISQRATDQILVDPVTDGSVQLSISALGNKEFVFTDKALNGNGYPEPNPATVIYRQRADYSATYSSTASIPSPRLSFRIGNQTTDNPAAIRTLVSNSTNGQANVTVQSTYNDSGPTVINSSGSTTVEAQLQSINNGITYALGSPKQVQQNFDLALPPGRCFRLATYNYGVRMNFTRDVFGNNNWLLTYGVYPPYQGPATGGSGYPEVKWMGLHTSLVYAPINRPLFDSSGTRYYSSEGHRAAYQAANNKELYKSNKVIPEGYFVILSFGRPTIGQITLVGSDNQLYPIGTNALWGYGSDSDNNSSNNNDSFFWNIYQFVPPAGVTFSYCFISDVGSYFPIRYPQTDPLVIHSTQPGTVGAGTYVNQLIAVAGGGSPQEYTWDVTGNLPQGLYLEPSGGLYNNQYLNLVGLPRLSGVYNWTVTLTDYIGQQVSQDYNMVIASQMSLTGLLPTEGMPEMTVGVPLGDAYLNRLYANDSGSQFRTYTVTVLGGGKPAWLTISVGATVNWAGPAGSTIAGLIACYAPINFTGTPTATGTFPFVIRIQSSSGAIADIAITIKVNNQQVVQVPVEESYTVWADKSEISEGESVTIRIKTGGLYQGYTVPWAIQPLSSGFNSSDIVGGVTSGNFSLLSSIQKIPVYYTDTFYDYATGQGQEVTYIVRYDEVLSQVDEVTITAAADLLTEGTEYFRFILPGIASQSKPGWTPYVDIGIRDTSQAAIIPTYQLAASTGSVAEGNYFTVTLTTTSVSAGQQFGYQITGVTNRDINNAGLQGNFVIDQNGQATVQFYASPNGYYDPKTFVLSVPSLGLATYVAITDSAPTYRLTTSAQQINEGSSVSFNLYTESVVDGTEFPYTITGISAGDIEQGLDGVITIYNNHGGATITAISDSVTEGQEVMTFAIPSLGLVSQVAILDTSTAPVSYNLYLTDVNGSYLSGSDELLEGSQFNINIGGLYTIAGTTVRYSISGLPQGMCSIPLNGTIRINLVSSYWYSYGMGVLNVITYPSGENNTQRVVTVTLDGLGVSNSFKLNSPIPVPTVPPTPPPGSNTTVVDTGSPDIDTVAGLIFRGKDTIYDDWYWESQL